MLPANESSVSLFPLPPEIELGEAGDTQLMQTLFHSNQHLREQIAHHTQLMQLLTHQLATPLTSLSGSIQLLAEPDLAPGQRQEFLGVVEQQIDRLRNLFQDLMALQAVEMGSLQAQPTRVPLQQVLQEVAAEFAPYPVVAQSSTELPEVWCDRWQVSQVIVNLLSNAVKYSPNGHPVELGAALTSPGWVEVWVQDHGLGIPTADQPHLFDRFYRVNHRDRQTIDGTGLGLSLCKLLVENQGGAIGFESTHGQGSRFYFTVPLAESVSE